MNELTQRLEGIGKESVAAVNGAKSVDELNTLRVRYLGRKGELTAVLRGMADLPAQDRPVAGQLANSIRVLLEDAIKAREEQLKKEELDRRLRLEAIDVTLPVYAAGGGSIHPLATIRREIEDIFIGLGFAVVEGPEVESDYYNFEALNMAGDHPARDMWDTFFIGEEILLRTHTSPVQVRVMEKIAPALPVRILAPGKVYRRDDDATHSPMFHQIEGLAVDTHITLSNLKGVLSHFARRMFGEDTSTRFRPSYFPFTEPSAEMDISCVICGGRGCRVCGHTGWLEILGAGMVHPRVLAGCGYDPEEVSGFAFGMGIDRIAMLKYGIDDLRIFFENDVRFLSQF